MFRSPILQTIRRLSTQTRQAIEQALKEDPVVLFMKGTPSRPMCGFSRAAIQVLSLENIDPRKLATYDVLADNELRQGIKEFSDWPTIPQLYVHGEFVGGTDLLLTMHKSGELRKMFKEADVVDEASEEAAEENGNENSAETSNAETK
ncbi:monothiol glutaredoxin Grx5 [Schizosaccharomyces japonicus yFS275]|uniref:Monothiol glutaredoxin-5, mitochondrial n=1 Tax=Schizosaccharomyces japonicus (strain yFS275 / FY16936) TaxID=402676 RepID=B6JXV4_SCHJY|nr:monothiol glutaredoxin Grx5 [Schizosaccharomyces japonicus yFS275]EEB06372.1 monothiol glutaredoxin Grx5 [Schizosaccharomyces japonicus yFS275]